MSEWTIYHNDNTELTVVKELEYHDEWMVDGYVSVTVKSATPVGFSIGDYLEYRGERFEINYDPNLIKRAKSGSYGDGFVYENVKLYSQSARLKDVGFLDYVLNWDSASNKNVYSSQGTFAFYAESVEDLADRIQANLDRHSNGEWLVLTPNWSRSSQRGATTDWWTGYFDGTWGGAIRTEGKTDVSVSADNLSCRDALNLSYTAFDLSYYVTSKTVTSEQTSTTKKLVIIGGKSVSASHIFKYGKGNGLYEIERTSDDSERIITKLFAYGSDKNLPLNFYANIGKRMFFTLVTKTSRTIIMGNDTLLLWTNIPWTDKLDNAFAPSYYGVRLEYTNQSQQYFAATFGVMGDTYTFGDEKDDDSTILDHTTKYLVFYILSSYTGAESFYGAVSADSKIYITSGVNLNKLPESMIETPLVYDYPALLSISKLMLPGFPSQSLFDWVVNHGATNIDYNNYKAKWHGHTAYFSTDPHNPWIMSLRADEIGVREGTVNFDGSAGEDEIYPTIEGRSDGYNNRADAVAWAEQMDDSGYLGENPKDSAKLFKFKPNMVDGIFIDWTDNDGDVAVTMQDGPCVGREFKMNSAKLNDDGDWEITLERQQDTSLLRYFPYKEPDSDKLFQVLGSENVISGADVNHFIVTGINLPESFVENASQKLLEKALEQLDKKDHQSFTYLPKVDEIYMKRQDDAVQAGRDAATYGTVSLHDTLRAGMQMRIKDTDLDIDYRPFIDVLTIKENGNNGIPTYDVVLRDDKELTMQQRIQSQIEGGKDAILNLGGDGSSYPLTSEFLSRLKDDEAKGLITFLKGLQVGDRFVTGLLGEGGIFRKDADGKTYIEADKLYIRMKAYFDTVEVRKFIHSGGNRIASPAGGKCVRVEYMAQYNSQWVVVDENGVYTWRDSQGVKHTATPVNGIEKIRCYFRGEDDGMTVTNDWQVGDQAYCKVTNERLNMHMFWRLVIGTSGNTLTDDGEFWIDLSNKDTESITSGTYAGKMDGSDLPIAQDSIVQLGNVDDPDRRGAIIEFVTAENSPSYQIFQNLGEPAPAGSSTSEMKAAQFSYDDKYYIGFGFNSTTNRAYMDVYGDFFFGAKEDPITGESPTYIKYTQEDDETHQPKLEIKAIIEVSSPLGGTEVPTTIGDILNDIDDLQSQIDGSIETWFEDYMPVSSIESTVPLLWLDNAHTIPCLPYKDWYDADVAADNNNERLRHLGDVFYDNTSGYAFRFSNTGTSESPVFSWVLITDSAVVEALKIANSKNKVISTTAGTLPTPPYETGDLWVNATGTFTYTEQGQTHSVTYDNDILRCINAKARGESASITDWILASRYTDDTVVEHYMDILAGGVSPTKQDKEAALAAERAIRTALGGKTIIEGGLMLTSIIGMRKLNHPQDDPDDPDNYTTYAGISGVYDTNLYGGGIAAWYGGGMVDKRDSTTGEYTVVNGAKSGFRFDGSGWLADGNIFWDAAGSVTIKNITTLSDSQNTNILNELATFNSAFSFSTSGSGSGQTVISITPNVPFTSLSILDTSVSPNVGRPVATQKWVEDNFMTIAAFETLFNAINSSGNKVNHPYSSAVASIKAMFGLWTDQYLSAKGLNSSGGSGGVGDVTWDLLANSSDTRPIALSHLTTALSSYATQSWVSSQGYLTSIPTASSSTKGGVKVGSTLAISNEVLNLASVTITAPATGDTTYTKVYVDGYGRVTKATTLSDTDIPSLAASKITSGTLDVARIPNLSWNKITTDKPTTLSGYGITDGVKDDTTWWGRSISSGAVKGSIEKATSLEFDNIGSSANNGGYIDFHYNGDNTSNSGDYTSRIIEDQSGIIKINNTLFAKLSGGVTIGTSTVGSNYKLEVSGVIGLTGSTKRIYFSDMNHYIELDSNGYFHFSHGLYSDSFVSAKGLNSNSGSSITLNEPLNGINNAGLSAPTSSAAGQTVVWNGSAWTYSINTTLRAGNLASAGGATIYGNVLSEHGDFTASAGDFVASAGHGFKVTGGSNDEVLLANGTKITLKTVNGYSLFGSGNIDASGGGTGNYLPLAGGTMTGHITMGGQALYFGKSGSNALFSYSSNYPNYGIWYHDEAVDKLSFSASGNANTPATADLCINGAGNGTVTIRGNTIIHSGNILEYNVGNADTLDNYHAADFLLLSGGVMSGTLIVSTSGTGAYNQGIRINRASEKGWCTLLIGANGTSESGSGTETAGYGAWLIATPMNSNSLIFNLNSASESVGLCLKGHGTDDAKWNNNTIYHAGNLTLSTLGGQPSGNYVEYEIKASQTTLNNTSSLPKFFDIENLEVVSGFGQFYHVINLGRYSGGNYGTQIATIFQSSNTLDSELFIRRAQNTTWKPWRRVLHDNNYTEYTVTKTGSGASGTWGISINGNAATATKLSSSVTLWGNTFDGSSDINGIITITHTNTWLSSAKLQLGRSDTTSYTDRGCIGITDGNLHIDSYPNKGIYFNFYSGNKYFALGNVILNERAFSGLDSIDSFLHFDRTNSRIGISTNSPTQKLEVNGDVKATNFRGNLIGNADTATKLQTSRSIWGQSFDGSGDVTGDITVGNGNIYLNNNKYIYWKDSDGTSRAAIFLSDTNNFRIGYGMVSSTVSYNTIITGYNVKLTYGSSRTDGFILNSSGNVGIGVASPSYKLHVDGTVGLSGINFSNSDGVTMDEFGNIKHKTSTSGNHWHVDTSSNQIIISATTGGSVGIGTNTPSQKLDVDGNIKTSTSDGAFIQIGGARIVWDNTNKALKVIQSDNSTAANFYATGAVSALGANTSSGGSGSGSYIPLSGSNAITGSLIPSNSTSDLGQSASGGVGRWRKVWSIDADFTGTVSAITFSATNFNASSLATSGTITCGNNLFVSGNVGIGYSSAPTSNYHVVISSRNVSSVGYGLQTYGQNYFDGNTIIASGLTVGQSSLNTSYKFYVNGTSYFSGNAVFGNATISNTSGSGTSETKLETSLAVLRLKAASSVYANNTVISSDMRLKYIRSYANASIDQIANAPVFNFVFTDSPQYIHLGTSAQYWQTIFPCGVSEMPDTYLAMDYGATALAAAVITARRVQNHEDRIRELEYENEKLRNEIEMLKAA